MKSSVVFKKKNTKLLLLSLFVAAAFLAICSKSSPLYPFNDWVDANVYFNVGKAIMNGKVLYRDIFDHKGPLIYFLHGLAYLISNRSFLGVYFLESISFGCFLYFSIKTINLYIENLRISLLALPIISFAVLVSQSFSHGDSAEELCLVFLGYTIYSTLKALKENRLPSFGELALSGGGAMCVFLIKYSMLGFYIGYVVFVFILSIRKKQACVLIKLALCFLGGAAVVLLPYLIYGLFTNSLRDFFNVYIYSNLFLYSDKAFLGSIGNTLLLLLFSIRLNPIFGFFILLGLFWMLTKRNMESLFFLLTLFLLNATIFIGGVVYIYYPLVLSAFSSVGVAGLLSAFNNILKKPPNRTALSLVSVFLCAGLLIVCYFASSNTYFMKNTKESLPQFQFEETINSVENPDIINFGFLDFGFDTVSGSIPNKKYFFMPNIKLPEITSAQKAYIENGECDFIITVKPLSKYNISCDKYKIAATYIDYKYEGYSINFYLYQLID